MNKNKLKVSKFCIIHPDKPVQARGLCKNCYDKWLKENNPEYLEKQKRNCEEWSKKNQARKRENEKNWLAKQDKDYSFIKTLQKYRLTPDDYNELLSRQDNKCAICNKVPKENKRLHVDHDHNTGLVRGLLCFRCNFGLSYFAENYDNINRAAKYLESAEIRSQEWNKEIESKILERSTTTIKEEKIILNAKTRGINDEDANNILNRYDWGYSVKHILSIYPEYSRSAIYRLIKNRSQNTCNK